MIGRDEIEAKATELGIHTSNVQRDYVFGWLVGGLYLQSALRDTLVLKGGNALRKAYFPATRYSDDLDFTTTEGLDDALLVREFNDVCRLVSDRTGVRFDLSRNAIVDEHLIDRERRVYKMRLYFSDFYGNADHITLRVRVDITEFDRIYLPVQTRRLIHQYSDSDACAVDVRVIKLEEALADKMKCLLQRRYAFDLFDLVYGIFVNRELGVDRGEIVRTFLRKTIFEPSPAAARDLILGAPFELVRGFWSKIVCPKATAFSFESAMELLRSGIAALFAPFGGEYLRAAFFPAELRNPILQAASSMTLLRIQYDGIERVVEPYSLVFKRRKDGVGQEYFYGWDRSGGRRSGPGIKAFLQGGFQGIANTEEPFDARFPVELAKAGDRETAGYFARPFGSAGRNAFRLRNSGYGRATHILRCVACGRTFTHTTTSTALGPHKDGYGNDCYGRIGYRVF